MAQKRMFSLKVIDTDLFLEMPMTTRLLYYDLSMRADDDGFVSSPRKIQRMIGCSDDDFKLLIAKKFIIPFESGICVIKHWRINNYIQKDRYTPTFYKSEMAELQECDDGYELLSTECIQDVSKMDTQIRLDKIRLDKDSIDKDIDKKKHIGKQYEPVISSYTSNEDLIKTILDFIEMRKKIKKPLTDKALTLILNKLNSLSMDDNTKIDILNQSIMNSWQGVFPLKEDRQQGNGNYNKNVQAGIDLVSELRKMEEGE